MAQEHTCDCCKRSVQTVNDYLTHPAGVPDWPLLRLRHVPHVRNDHQRIEIVDPVGGGGRARR